MLNDDVMKKIASFFDMPVLNTGRYEVKDEHGNTIKTFRVLLYWVAEIPRLVHDTGENLIVAVLHCDEWHKGLILIPPIHSPRDREFGGPKDLMPLDLDKEDVVPSALKCVDLTYHSDAEYLGNAEYHFHLLTGTRKSRTNFYVAARPGENPNLDKLWNALLATMSQLADLYSDDEIFEFIIGKR